MMPTQNQKMFTFLLSFAAVAAGGKVHRRQADCSTTTTLDALTVTRVEPMSIYMFAEQQQTAPTGTAVKDERFTAVYTTVYPTFCPTCSQGLRPETYTITQTCTGSITSCHGHGDDLPPGFTTTQAVCTDCPTPITAVLTVPQQTDAVVTMTYEQVVTEAGLTTTMLVTKTCREGPCLPDITAAAVPDSVRTINGGTIVVPVTVTKTQSGDKTTVIEKETATVTATDSDRAFNPGNFNSGAGHMVFSNKFLAFAISSFVLVFLISA